MHVYTQLLVKEASIHFLINFVRVSSGKKGIKNKEKKNVEKLRF